MKKTFTATIAAIISLVGNAQEPVDTTTIELTDTTAWNLLLDGVTVKAQHQLVKQEIDRTTYDVQADDDSKTQTVIDMLRKVPMVTVDGEDNILVKGNKNFKIYKNGHLDPSLTKNAKDILKAMPASSIKRIEVITDPGAREDAEGVNAILNIVMMDTKRMQGITGSVSASYSTLNYPSLSTYLAAQFGKFIISFDYGSNYMSKRATRNDVSAERTFVNTGNTQLVRSRTENPGHVHYADINASYDIDSLNLLSASFGGYFYSVDVQGGGTISMIGPDDNCLSRYDEQFWMPSYSHHSWNGRLDYEHKMRRRGEKFTLSYMLALTRQHTEQETNYTNTQDFAYNYTGFLENGRERFTEHTFQFDYVRPLWEGHKLEVGAKYIDRINSSVTSQEFYDDTHTTTSDDFSHTMRIAALYADYMWSHENWSARAGVRYEYSYMKGHYRDGKSADFDKHLNDWVPQASLKYQIDERQSLKLVYTTSINRPGIIYLNPAVHSFPAAEQFGNARLGSVRSQSIGLPYMYTGQRLTVQIWPQYLRVNNAIGKIVYAKGDVRYQTFGNVIRQNRWQIEGYVQWKPFDSTTLVANLNFSHNHFISSEQGLVQDCNCFYYYCNLSQKLPWRLKATAYTFGMIGHSSDDIYTYAGPYFRYGFSLQRSFLKDDRLTVRLSATAPFNKQLNYTTCTTQGDVVGKADYINTQNNRSFQLTVSFRFGSLKNKVKKTDTTIENDDVQGGISRTK